MAGTPIPTKRDIPGVYKLENDLSLVISPSSALYVACVLESEFGVADQPFNITSETQLVNRFGEPTDENFNAWFNITQPFSYKVQGLGAVMKVVRVLGDGCKNSVLTVSPTKATAPAESKVLIKNDRDVDAYSPIYAGTDVLDIFTKFPTTKKIKVAIANKATIESAEIYNGVKFIDNIDYELESDKQFVLFVLDEKDNILEKFHCSMDPKEKDERTNVSLSVEAQINDRSHYIVAFSKTKGNAPASFKATELTGGVYNAPTEAQVSKGYMRFENVNKISLQYILGVGNTYDAINQLAIKRDDCSFRSGVDVADIIGLEEVDAYTALKNKYKNRPNTTRGSVVSEIKMIDDVYNGKKRWISMAGDMIGLRVQQNLSKEPWFSDGGYNYGLIQNAIKIGQEWAPESVRELIKSRFNPVIAEDGVGFLKIEQHNFTSKNSALRDENVRELVNYIYRASKVFLKYKLHELNDEFTRYDTYTKMNRFLANVQAGRGIRKTESGSDGYTVVCDSTNNTDDVINQNMLIIDIVFLPARAITEVYLRVNIAASGIQLELK